MVFVGNSRSAVMADNRIAYYLPDRAGLIILMLAIVILGLFYGLRSYETGIDSYRYVIRMSGDFGDLAEDGAIGYALIVTLLRAMFADSYTVVFLFFALLTAFCLLKSLCHLCPHPLIGVIIIAAFGYMFEGVNQFRQLAAMSMAMLSVVYLLRSKTKGFLVIVLLAASIHPSAAVFLLVFLLRNYKFSDTALLAVAGITVAITVVMPGLKSYFSVIPVFGSYVGSEFDKSAETATYLNFLFRLLLFIFVIANRKRLRTRFVWSDLLFMIVLLGSAFQAFTLEFSMFSRVSSYFMIFYAVVIPATINAIDRKNARLLATMCVMALFIALLLVNATVKFSGDKYIYRPFWDASVELRAR